MQNHGTKSPKKSEFQPNLTQPRVNFPLPRCDEYVLAGQNVFQGPTIHLPRLECCVESHRLHLLHLMCCCFQMRFQKGH